MQPRKAIADVRVMIVVCKKAFDVKSRGRSKKLSRKFKKNYSTPFLHHIFINIELIKIVHWKSHRKLHYSVKICVNYTVSVDLSENFF